MDMIEKIDGALIQHGKNSNRIYLMKLGVFSPQIIKKLDDLAVNKGYTKIFAKIPFSKREDFLKNGYVKEASIPGYFKGEEEVVFLCKYFDFKRMKPSDSEHLNQVIEIAKSKAGTKPKPLSSEFKIIQCQSHHAEEMATVYQKVFASYPFPIHDPSYLIETMKTHISYFAVVKEQQIVALSSIERDHDSLSAEMTDFATLPEYRGNGFAVHLLKQMEDFLINSEKIKTVYTIARAESFGMNCTFARCGYDFSGTLVNNTGIAGKIESMNVWYKSIF